MKEMKDAWLIYDTQPGWDGALELVPFGLVTSEDEAKEVKSLLYDAHFFPITHSFDEEYQEKRRIERESARKTLKEKYNLECDTWSAKIERVKWLEKGENVK